MTKIQNCPYCNSDLSTKKELVKTYNDLCRAFPNAHVEWFDSEEVFDVDYDNIIIVYKHTHGQWMINSAFIKSPDFNFELKSPEKCFKDPKEAFDNAKNYWELDVKD